MSTGGIDISRLSLDERLRLLETLWESFEARPEDLPLTDAQREELDRRAEAMDRDGSLGTPWQEVVHRVRDRIR